MILRPKQIPIFEKGLAILKQYNLLYNAIEMRIGKTIISLTLAQYLMAKRVLFVTPLRNIQNVEGNPKTGMIGDFEKMGKPFELTVSTFESLHKILEKVLAGEIEFDVVIVDEAHRLGTFQDAKKQIAQNIATRCLKRICRGIPVILQSGTPTPETFSQLYHQFWISDYTPFKDYPDFESWAAEFVNVKNDVVKMFNRKTFEKYEIKAKNYKEAYEQKIFEAVDHLFVRVSQKDYGFLQEIQDRVIFCDKSPVIHKLEMRIRNEKKLIYDGLELDATKIGVLKQKIIQLHSGTIIMTDNNDIDNKTKKGKRKARIIDTSKAEFIKKEFQGQKIAIFYIYQAELTLLKSVFPNYTTDQHEFNSNTDLVYLGQIKSSREGLNLKTADCIVMYNISYPALNYWQARSRLLDAERKEDALVWWVFTRGGIESSVYGIVNDKKDYTLPYFKKDWLKKNPSQLTLF